MKLKHIVFASAMLISVSSFAQKDEFKKLKKIYDKDVPSANDLTEYKATLEKLQPLAISEADKIYYDYYRVNLPSLEIASLGPGATPDKLMKFLNPKAISEMADVYNATLEYEKKAGKKQFTDDINEEIGTIKPMLINGSNILANQKKYLEASDVLYAIYKLDKNDQNMLFYAASYAVTGKDYDKALQHYNELKKINYSGEAMVYMAVNKQTKEDENFGANKTLRDMSVNTAKTHEKPRDEKIPSKRGEIYKNIALILVEKGKTAEAITAVQDARKVSPDDESLLFTEMDLYLKLKDFDTYSKLVNEALAKDPNNADLVFNLGVIAGNADKLEEAQKYYKKAIEIKPDYFNAYLNLSELLLRSDAKFVDEMNKLGTSEKDNKRYAVLKAEREKNFKSILPYLEKAVELDSTSEPAKKTLLSVYNALEMTDKYKALKAKM
jgi:tetratricopeptide (TPR) repeat protein